MERNVAREAILEMREAAVAAKEAEAGILAAQGSHQKSACARDAPFTADQATLESVPEGGHMPGEPIESRCALVTFQSGSRRFYWNASRLNPGYLCYLCIHTGVYLCCVESLPSCLL